MQASKPHATGMDHAHAAYEAISSMHLAQDFYNLVDVYLDAVLHPNCVRDPRTFAQEGWHYEIEDPKVRAAVCFHVRLAHGARPCHKPACCAILVKVAA